MRGGSFAFQGVELLVGSGYAFAAGPRGSFTRRILYVDWMNTNSQTNTVDRMNIDDRMNTDSQMNVDNQINSSYRYLPISDYTLRVCH